MVIPNLRKTRYLLWFQGNTQVLRNSIDGNIWYRSDVGVQPQHHFLALTYRELTVLLEICWPVGIVYGQLHQAERANMKNPLDSITGTIVSGVVITIILYVFVSGFLV
jgi:hypothetical protein